MPGFFRTIPAFENMLSLWEAKSRMEKYAPIKHAIEAGITKMNKYYNLADRVQASIVTLSELYLPAIFTQLADRLS